MPGPPVLQAVASTAPGTIAVVFIHDGCQNPLSGGVEDVGGGFRFGVEITDVTAGGIAIQRGAAGAPYYVSGLISGHTYKFQVRGFNRCMGTSTTPPLSNAMNTVAL